MDNDTSIINVLYQLFYLFFRIMFYVFNFFLYSCSDGFEVFEFKNGQEKNKLETLRGKKVITKKQIQQSERK